MNPTRVAIESASALTSIENIREALSAEGFIVTDGLPQGDDRRIKFLRDAQIIVAGSQKYPAPILENLPDLRLIIRFGTGFDNVDLEYATSRNIKVAITPGGIPQAVAQHTMALINELCLRIYGKNLPAIGHPLILGIIGMGRIGSQLAQLARPSFASIMWCRYRRDDFYYVPDASSPDCASFRQLLENADVLSLNLPLNKGTLGMIGHKPINMLKKKPILVNTARQELVDVDTILMALDQGTLGGFGMDFEPDGQPGIELAQHRNVVLTPHIAAKTPEVLKQTATEVVDSIVAYAHGDISRLKQVYPT
jgi:D-3-phosphoglycerate dehydrogenase